MANQDERVADRLKRKTAAAVIANDNATPKEKNEALQEVDEIDQKWGGRP